MYFVNLSKFKYIAEKNGLMVMSFRLATVICEKTVLDISQNSYIKSIQPRLKTFNRCL